MQTNTLNDAVRITAPLATYHLDRATEALVYYSVIEDDKGLRVLFDQRLDIIPEQSRVEMFSFEVAIDGVMVKTRTGFSLWVPLPLECLLFPKSILIDTSYTECKAVIDKTPAQHAKRLRLLSHYQLLIHYYFLLIGTLQLIFAKYHPQKYCNLVAHKLLPILKSLFS